jgi:hypothetical protein
LEDVSVEERVILKWIFRKWDRGMGWIDLVEERYRWRELVNAVVYLGVP